MTPHETPGKDHETDDGFERWSPKEPFAWLRWPWNQWSAPKRLAVLSRGLTKILASGVALITAVVYLYTAAPKAYQQFAWRPVEYRLLSDIHAGYSMDYVVEKLGEPIIVNSAPGARDYTQSVFRRRDYFAYTVSDSSNQVVIFGILSCAPSFAPEVSTPGGTVLQLQSKPLADAETVSDPTVLDNRTYSYAPAIGSTSADQIIEGYEGDSSASMYRGYYYGVNGACGDYKSRLRGTSEQATFFGSLSDAPRDAKDLRSHVGANFYAETYGLDFLLTEGATMVSSDEKQQLLLSPNRFDFPRELLRPDGIRFF